MQKRINLTDEDSDQEGLADRASIEILEDSSDPFLSEQKVQLILGGDGVAIGSSGRKVVTANVPEDEASEEREPVASHTTIPENKKPQKKH